MINYNGELLSSDSNISNTNRAFLFGDGVFETLKIVNNKILFLEDHYFRLMASMRIVRMQIPNNFTLEYIEEQTTESWQKLTIVPILQEFDSQFLEMMVDFIFLKLERFPF
jgi:branched-chain amino acid aminotransferase